MKRRKPNPPGRISESCAINNGRTQSSKAPGPAGIAGHIEAVRQRGDRFEPALLRTTEQMSRIGGVDRQIGLGLVHDATGAGGAHEPVVGDAPVRAHGQPRRGRPGRGETSGEQRQRD